MPSPTALATSPFFLRHDTGPGHPERPERLSWILDHLKSQGLLDRARLIDPAPAERGWIESIHDPAYVERVEAACRRGDLLIDSMDTAICPESFDAALLAAGAGIALGTAVLEGHARNGMALVRPPGHHAERSLAMGFCLFNNVAILAKYLLSKPGIDRVLIVDWDVHHGNGTQNSFERDPAVFYFSIHQWPHYPGTGAAGERGRGPGEGTTLNLPAPAGWGDEEYLRAFRDVLVPAAIDFDPQFVLVSAGFDAHLRDPLAEMRVTEEGYAAMTRIVREIAQECCDERVVSLLEGGYDPVALPRSVAAHVAPDVVDAPSSLGDPSARRERLAGVGGGAVADPHLGRDGPRVEAGRRPGHHLVEQRGQQAAMDLVLPADEIRARRPGGRGGPLAELDLEPHADRVRVATREAVVVGERVASPVAADDEATAAD